MSRSIRRNVGRPSRATLDLMARIASLVEEKTLERIRGYLARGRPLAGMPAESLDVNWAEACRAARTPEGARSDAELLDLRCEFDWRGLKPPWHLIAAEVARLGNTSKD
jgi:hypothetical protein